MEKTFFLLFVLFAVGTAQAGKMAGTHTPGAIPWRQIGAAVGGEQVERGLTVTPAGTGARLHCVFQRLDGEATPQGLWLTSTVTNAPGDRFQVTATEIGRGTPANLVPPGSNTRLAGAGKVSVSGKTARFSRPGLTEEYSVSVDGVRQDFVVEQSPAGPAQGGLVVTLAVTGVSAEPAPYGAQLRLAESGRKLAYGGVRACDARGRDLPAHLEVRPGAGSTVAIVVDDAQATYPVRIDPTFSDANWVSMGGLAGANAGIYAMAVDSSGNLYVGGGFTIIGNVMANGVARWNGSQWSALGSGLDGTVWAMVLQGGTLYVSGEFTTAGGNPASNIAQWDGSQWSALGLGMNGPVWALAEGQDLYAGGSFSTAGGNAAVCIARWDGANWLPMGSAANGQVYALAVSGQTLYAAGEDIFIGTNFLDAVPVAQWDGTNWSGVGRFGGVAAGTPYALAVSGQTLYVGGDFTSILTVETNNLTANYIAEWDGSDWTAVGLGMNDAVQTLAVFGGTLYAGGQFTTADGNAANHLAQWNGSQWSPVGSGMNGNVQSLAMSGGTLYAGGGFTTAGANAAICVAQWNGSDWLPLGLGLNGYPQALAVSGSTLYAGGTFTMMGTNALNYIAQWNGDGWSALGSGMNSNVDALAVSGSSLYAGGGFTTAGTNAANYIAQWNGTNWLALGSGMNSNVDALAVSGSSLYAGGGFTTAGTNAANYIAQWNGTNWLALGLGMGGLGSAPAGVYPSVNALAVSGGALYAGGLFLTAGGAPANYLAQWESGSWSALGSGLGGYTLYPGDPPAVSALALLGGNLYAGGIFLTAGTNVSPFAAEALLGGAPVNPGIVIVTTNAALAFTNGLFGFDVSGPAGSNVVIEASANLRTWVPLQTNLLGAGLFYFTDPQSRTNRGQFYRAELLP
jgi:hypothetical protein